MDGSTAWASWASLSAQLLTIVASEGAAWTTIGAVAGTLLDLVVSVALVHVVNPQSFHWTMDLRVSRERLLALGLTVVAAGDGKCVAG